MFLVVGLGNPGIEHKNNRHNVGYRVIQSLAESLDVLLDTVECRAIVGKGEKDGISLLLAQPLTFVNASGESLRDLVNKYNLLVKDVIVIHDDLDLQFREVMEEGLLAAMNKYNKSKSQKS